MRVLGTVDVRDGRVDEVERIDAERLRRDGVARVSVIQLPRGVRPPLKGLNSRKRERGYTQTMLAGPSKRSVKYEGKTDYKV